MVVARRCREEGMGSYCLMGMEFGVMTEFWVWVVVMAFWEYSSYGKSKKETAGCKKIESLERSRVEVSSAAIADAARSTTRKMCSNCFVFGFLLTSITIRHSRPWSA